ncbi:tRNA (adenosine(37)-N6)-threonylcarbamoyltransferase complex ATPase subunit type 1 TsaE [Rothia nasimurium]|uniref:tRNA (adenosine(37)-N6)-threonylcarbamoyltransferase complex ATPase subunit type 1 TsaE n=1 Tax=Rothia nasimurium TaxID=85336 RepID=UPI001624B20B|nr:tRNA (adenosine(37)-N6)-threonylcarbamoyltransferase complex ATPase subunit type 1 TsaE [Rothia nasimurium]
MTDRVLDLEITGPEHTRAIALALAPLLTSGDVLILTGELGAGKTTFTRSLGEGLGVREGVISPTFVLSRVHPNLPDGPRPGGPDLVHVDAYRLASSEELDDLDLEYSLDRSVTVIEWGRDKAEHLSESILDLEFTRVTGADLAETDPYQLYAPGQETERDDEEGNPEPRRLRLIGQGPRWEAIWHDLTDTLTSVGLN